jgi:hypothetical protein
MVGGPGRPKTARPFIEENAMWKFRLVDGAAGGPPDSHAVTAVDDVAFPDRESALAQAKKQLGLVEVGPTARAWVEVLEAPEGAPKTKARS